MFTYDTSLADPISQIRFYLRDTIPTSPYFQDEELNFLYIQSGNNVYKAAAEAAFALYTEFASLSTVAEVDDVRIESRDKAKWFKQVYEEFKQRAMRDRVPPIIISGGDRTAFTNSVLGRPSTQETNKFFDK